MPRKRTTKRGNNEGTIRQRNDGRWEARFTYWDGEGIRQRKSIYADTRDEARQRLNEAQSQLAKGIAPVDERITFGRYLEQWLTTTAAPVLKPKTLQSYRHLVEKHIAPALGRQPLNSLTPQTLRAFLTAKRESGLSGRTVQYAHAVIRKALGDALKDGLVVRNVATLVKPPRAEGKEVHPLKPEECRRFLEAIQGDRLEALFAVAVALGLRQGECFGLQWSDLDFENKLLHVRHSLARVGKRIILGSPKSKKAVRTVGLPNLAATALAAHRQRQELEVEFAGDRWQAAIVEKDGQPFEADLVFRSTIGTPLDTRNVTQGFQKILKASGLPRHRFHDLRHSAATLLLTQGVHPRAIQGILGWDQGSMLERYTHLVDEIRRDAATQMDAILNPVGVKVGVKTTKRAN
jgi:integrase